MTLFKRVLLVAAVCMAGAGFAPSAWGQSNPHVGYVYPAGGQQGSTFEVTAGGQFLGGVNNVYVSGEGVHASVVQYGRPFNNQQLAELRKQITALLKARRAAETGKGVGSIVAKGEVFIQSMLTPLPAHPLLRHVDTMGLKELEYWFNLATSNKRQPNAQLGEMVVLEVMIDPGAVPGDRELRLGTPNGLTNPLRFQVGSLPEVLEQEPNDQKAVEGASLDLPVLLNGQIMPGDVDRFRFRARQGQHLVMAAQARRLMPYLADAVPGWFQAALTLYDAKGKEVAFADDYRFDPDPVLFYEVPEDGEYEIEIRDSIYRGREDFVYRIAAGELPFITEMFPLGGQAGEKTVAEIAGWNLPGNRLPLDTQPGGYGVRVAALPHSNGLPYAVDALPERQEKKSNNTVRKAQHIKLPHIINGRIERPGDVDLFRFKGRAGDDVVAEVYARRLGSPLDSVLQLTDAAGHVLASNDDCEDKASGLLTQHADSYVRFHLPKDGDYYVHLADSQHHGGPEYAYRLRIGPPQPDFALRVTPSSINVPAGRVVPICVYALRHDGFDGDIDIALKDAPAGLTLNGGHIPGGRDSVRMTLAARGKPLEQPLVVQLEGRAQVGGETVTRPAVPAEDMMQAFAYRHLAPSQELMLAVTGGRQGAARVELTGETPVRIPLGGTAQVRIKTPKNPKVQDVQLALSEPPKGVTLQDVTASADEVAFTLKAEGDTIKPGYADNLIVEAFVEPPVQLQSDKPAKQKQQKQRNSLGLLPAIPFVVVQP